ncbi:MAG: flagellar biosynthesis protein FlhF, partial [Pseudobdellovibrionaceae bacterium]
IQVKSQPLNSRLHTFMGPPGSGKTSLLIKLASHLIAKENKTVMIATTDTFKVGATDQMRIFSQILNVPFAIIRATNDWVNILKAAQSFDYLFVDYPGLTMRTTEEQNLLERLLPPAGVSRDLHLVLSATDQDQFITEAGARYQKIGYDDVSFNFLDETFHHGSIYNFQNRFKCPYLSFGLGKKIPDDFEFATQERVLDLVLKVTQTMENRKAQHDTNSI